VTPRLEGCVRATSSEVGARIWRVRSPADGGASRLGGVAHGGVTAAVWVKVTDARGERGSWVAHGGKCSGKRKKKERKREKEKKKERKEKNRGKEMRSSPHNLGHENDLTKTILKPQIK